MEPIRGRIAIQGDHVSRMVVAGAFGSDRPMPDTGSPGPGGGYRSQGTSAQLDDDVPPMLAPPCWAPTFGAEGWSLGADAMGFPEFHCWQPWRALGPLGNGSPADHSGPCRSWPGPWPGRGRPDPRAGFWRTRCWDQTPSRPLADGGTRPSASAIIALRVSTTDGHPKPMKRRIPGERTGHPIV